jgi:F-type H+-transporting ATPase subunit alpha
LDELPVASLKRYEQELFERMDVRHKDILNAIADKQEIDSDTGAKLNDVLKDFTSAFKATV